MRPQRSLRLEKRSTKSLDTLSGASGEIFYDTENATLRMYTTNAGENIKMATQTWVQNELSIQATGIEYSNIVGTPTGLGAFTNDVGFITLADIPDGEVPVSSLIQLTDVTIDTPETGQLLEYNGTNWVNTTVAGFTDTNTTYNLGIATITDGATIDLTDSDAVTDSLSLLGGTGITVSITDTNELTIDSNITVTIDDLTNVSISNPADGQIISYSNGQWLNNTPSVTGVGLDDFSITLNPASGEGTLSYDNVNGIFEFTPPDLSNAGGIALTDLSIITSTADAGGSLTYNNTSGVFTFRPADLSSALTPTSIQFSAGVAINEFSSDATLVDASNTAVPTEAAVKTYVDNAVAGGGGGGGEVVDDTTPTLGGTLDADNNDITNVGTISATTYANAGTGAPVITSASTIELDAPDGIILGTPSAGNIVLETILDGADTGSNKNGEWKVKLSGPYGNISGEMFEIGQTTEFGNTLTFDISTNLNTHGAVINYTDDLIIKAPTITFDTGLIGERVGAATDSGTVVTIDTSNTSTAYNFSISGNRTLAFTNVPTTQDKIYTFSLFVVGAVTITGATVNGGTENPAWESGVNSTTGGNFSEITIRMLFAGGSTPELLGSIREYS